MTDFRFQPPVELNLTDKDRLVFLVAAMEAADTVVWSMPNASAEGETPTQMVDRAVGLLKEIDCHVDPDGRLSYLEKDEA